MIFDESNARLTQELTGRTIDFIARKGKELEIFCTDGHSVVIQADINGDIHYKQTNAKIIIPAIEMQIFKGDL